MSALKQLVTRRSELHRLKYLELFSDNDDGVWFELNDGIEQQEDDDDDDGDDDGDDVDVDINVGAALGSSRHVEGKWASHDSVDMAIKDDDDDDDAVGAALRSSRHVEGKWASHDSVDMAIKDDDDDADDDDDDDAVGAALGSSRHVEGKWASHDSVDMAIKGAKDVSHGIKRPLNTDGDMVYIFRWIDILIAVGSIIVFIVDIITDIKLAVEYYRDSQWSIAGVTTALIVIPSLITCGLSLHWYIIDFKIEEQVILKSKEVQKRVYAASEKLWFCRFLFTVLQLGPLVRTVEYIYYGCKSRSKNISEQDKKRYFRWMLYEDVDNCLLRLFESFLESAPQLCWQLYIFVKTKPEDDVIGETTRAVALLSSWVSLAMSLVSYHRSLRFLRDDKENLSLRSLPFYFVWRASETGGRVLCIALFASAFDQWVFAFLLLHWVIASGWLMSQHTTFYENKRCLEKAFNVICGYVMLFCFLNLREGHTRFRYLLFYFLFYVENFVMLAFWFRFTRDLGTWFHIWGFIVVLILFVLHVGSQLLYYISFHPTHSIKFCLPCDKYVVYSSICYEVDPDTDDAVESPNEHYTRREMSHGDEAGLSPTKPHHFEKLPVSHHSGSLITFKSEF